MKKLLVIGAGFLQAFVIKKAKEIGLEVLAVDANPDAEGFRLADKHAVINIIDSEACLEYAQKEHIDGVLTAATDFGVLTASYIAEKMGLPGLNFESAKLIKNKYLVRKCLFENGVDDSEQAFFASEDTDLDELKNKVSYPVMVKPCDGSGSRAASRVNKPEDFAEACKVAIAASIVKKAEIEAFITGKEYGAESLVINGEPHVFAIMQKKMTEPPYYAELGHTLPNDLPEETDKKAKECVKKALKALNVDNGSVNMDMIITDKGDVYIVDVGARMGGNMIGPCIIPYGTGIDYVKAMIANAVGDDVDLSPFIAKSAVVTRLLAYDDGIIRALPDFEALAHEYDVEIYPVSLAVGQMVREYHVNNDGLGYIIATADTVAEAAEKADAVYKLIKKLLFGNI